ncbi:MAG: T9SS C-terminal target domain-containing protein, partial [Ignavibacteriales bacterium]
INKGFDFYYRIQAKDKGIIPHFSYKPDSGFYKIVYTSLTDLDDELNSIPSEYKLEQNYPNPFNPITVISYQLPKVGNVTLKVFDVLGKEVATLVNEFRSAGSYEVEFNPESSIKNPASGIYFYQLKAGEFVETKKMLLLK